MNTKVSSSTGEVVQDFDHVASHLSREAVSILGFVARTSKATNQQQFLDEFTETINCLMDIRPSMMAIQNMVQVLAHKVYQKATTGIALDELRSSISFMNKQSIEDSLEADKKVSRLASQLIEDDNDRVISCSYSTTVIQAFKLAKESGRCFSVVFAESHTSKGRAYGDMAANELESQGMASQVTVDTSIRYHILQSSKVIVGIDAILKNGSILNGKPSYVLAN